MNAVWATRRTAAAFLAAGRTGQKRFEDEEKFATTFMLNSRAVRCVWPTNPFMLNERLTLQQGVFTCVGDVTAGFEDNLSAMAGSDNPDYLMKLRIISDKLGTILAKLYDLNVSRATLFPGLDGFSRSPEINLGSLPMQRDYPVLQE
jgi:hypothetical protein